jgi:RNase adapter protein RapZ
MLPNPHYEPTLRPLTGRDVGVASFLASQPQVTDMQTHIQQFVGHWLPALAQDQRSYVTVAIGCTGGQHRSVYLVEQVASHFEQMAKSEKLPWVVLRRHRELDGIALHA